MVLQVLIALLLALGLVKFGAMAVWVSVLSAVLKSVLFVVVAAAVCAVLWFLWRRYRSSDTHQ